jgi:UDP-4-amino-4-deoxy-L-arabinose-oxoglutarate aminotransferase
MEEPKLEFYRHHLGQAEKQACLTVLDSLFHTTGPACARFEKEFAEFLGVGQAVTMANCTVALELVLRALGVGPGDEVITTPMTFIATANAVLHAGATPVFVDVEPATGNLDASLVAAAVTARTKAILPVHLYGAMCDMRALRALADLRGLWLVADCAHAVESTRDGLTSAQGVDAACYSFYATKNLACGEGGAVATASEDLAERLRILRLHGMSKGAADRYSGRYQHWDMVELGYKANLSDIQASLLLPQLPGLLDRLARREAIARAYGEGLAGLPGVSLPAKPPGAGVRHGRHLFTIWVEQRDEFLAGLQERGIGVAVNYRAIHLLSYYRHRFGFAPGAFPVAERIGDATLSLPFYPGLTEAEVARVIRAVGDTARALAG